MADLVAELRASATPDTHVGDCMVRAADEIQALRQALSPFALAHDIAKRDLGMADVNQLDAVAKLYIRFSEMKEASRLIHNKEPSDG